MSDSTPTASQDNTTTSGRDRKKTGFLDLPAEIRNKIYLAMDLPMNKEIRIARKNVKAPKHNTIVNKPRSNVSDTKKIIGTRLESTTIVMKGLQPRRVAFGRAYDLQIMLTCRSIDAEVSAIVLGSNIFKFLNGHALIKFSATTGSKFAFLRNVVVVDMDQSLAEREVIRTLIPLQSPNSISCIKIDGTHGTYPLGVRLESEFIWKRIETFVTKRASWSTDDTVRPRSWTTTSIKDMAEQKKRLESLLFEKGKCGDRVKYENGTADVIKGEQRFHEILQSEVSKRWEEYIVGKQNNASAKKRKASAMTSDVAEEAAVKRTKVVRLQ